MMSKVTTLQERIEIMELAQAGKTDREISEQLKRPRSTVRKWRRRAQSGGAKGIDLADGQTRERSDVEFFVTVASGHL